MKASRTEILKHAESLQDGEQGYFHHENCSASHGQRDHQKRLWVKRDGQYIVYRCHHCSAFGSYYAGTKRKPKAEAASKYSSARSSTPGKHYPVPEGETDINRWPEAARIWILQYGITEKEVHRYGILYHHGIVLPVQQDTLLGYQVRKVPSEPGYPKYRTYRNQPGMYFKVDVSGCDTVVVTEDIISAIKCGRIMNSVALLGSTPSDTCFSHLITFKKVLIFMDNDNADIKSKQQKLKKRLELFTEVHVIKHHKDPKECTDTELKELLHG